MKNGIIGFLFALGFLFCVRVTAPATNQPLRVLLVTGGTPIRYHKNMVPVTLYTILNEDDKINWDHASLDEAAFENDIRDAYDVVVLFNRSDTISPQAKKNLKDFVDCGRGIVLLHSGLSSYNDWEWWWREVVGGKYQYQDTERMTTSGSSQDETIALEVNVGHPITNVVGGFAISDELYSRLNIQPGVQVLYKTANPKSDGPLVWIGPHKTSHVVAIQPGHSVQTYQNSHFKSLILNSILWAGGQSQPFSKVGIQEMSESARESVKQVIEKAYIGGIHGKQYPKIVKAGFHEDFNMIVPEENGNIRKVSVDAWLDFIENTAKLQNPELWNSEPTYHFDFVDVTDDAASVKIQVYKGERHFSTDYLLLYHFRNGWKIVSKIFRLW